MDARIESLVKSLERNHHRYKETFIDEDTGKEEVIDHDEIIAVDTTEEERELMESIIADVANLSDQDLETFKANTIWFWPRHFDEIYLELIRRGDEAAAAFIDNLVILQELCDKGNKYAAYELYEKCMWGDEENGIFINKREAKEYFDLAGDVPQEYEVEWDDSDDPGEEFPVHTSMCSMAMPRRLMALRHSSMTFVSVLACQETSWDFMFHSVC